MTEDDTVDNTRENSVDKTENGGNAVADRYDRVVRQFSSQKRGNQAKLKPLKVEERKERLNKVKQLIDLGMTVEQMQEFLPTVNIPASRSQVYKYLSNIRLPKRYKMSEGEQSHHDFFTFRTFIRIARDANDRGITTRRLQKGTSFEGSRFRPDFTFWIEEYLFFIELQLSDLAETRWTVKFKNYLRLYEQRKHPFRALFIVDQHRDMSYIRSHARKILRDAGRTELNLFLFCPLDVFRREDTSTSHDAVWYPTWGGPKDRVSLL